MSSEDARPRNHAVLIGTSRYDDARYLPVPAAVNSLRRMRHTLTDRRLCGWDPGDVTVFEEPDRQANLALQLRLIAEKTTGTFLVYFVGHGTTTERGELCLVTKDAHHDHPDVTGLPYAEVRTALLRSPAAVKIAILDCCSSGRAIQALSGSELADITAVSGTYTLTAADGPAHVVPLEQQAEQCTSFTREFCDLVQAGLPGGPDVLTLEDLWLPLRNRVRAAGLPLPNRKVYDTASHFPFTRNTALRPSPPVRRPASVRRGDTKALRQHVRIEKIAARYTRLHESGPELRGGLPAVRLRRVELPHQP